MILNSAEINISHLVRASKHISQFTVYLAVSILLWLFQPATEAEKDTAFQTEKN